jgi:hypothetical protein
MQGGLASRGLLHILFGWKQQVDRIAGRCKAQARSSTPVRLKSNAEWNDKQTTYHDARP